MVHGINRAEEADWREREKSAEKAKKAKTITKIELGRNMAGDHIVTHHFDNDGPGAYREPEKTTFKKSQGKKLIAHLVEHGGIEAGAEGQDDE